MSRLYDFMPGLNTLFNYHRKWFADDIKAALSVTAVALPVAIAYAHTIMGTMEH